MLKKLFAAAIALLGVFAILHAYYDDSMKAAEGVVELNYRTSSSIGSRFAIGTYKDEDTIFEAIKDDVEGGILAMSYGELIICLPVHPPLLVYLQP